MKINYYNFYLIRLAIDFGRAIIIAVGLVVLLGFNLTNLEAFGVGLITINVLSAFYGAYKQMKKQERISKMSVSIIDFEALKKAMESIKGDQPIKKKDDGDKGTKVH